MTRWIIVGSGLAGIPIAQQLGEKGEKVGLVEQRNHMDKITKNALDFIR